MTQAVHSYKNVDELLPDYTVTHLEDSTLCSLPFSHQLTPMSHLGSNEPKDYCLGRDPHAVKYGDISDLEEAVVSIFRQE
jgi:hypothetical protein